MDVFAKIAADLRPLGAAAFSVHQGKLYGDPVLADRMAHAKHWLIPPERHSRDGGEIPLRDIVADRFLGDASRTDELALCNGGTNALALAFAELLTPDRADVHVLSPYWLHLGGVIRTAGGRLIDHPTLVDGAPVSEDEILARVEAGLSPASRCIYLANPANPLGSLASDHLVAGLIDLAEKRDLFIIVDQAYYGFERGLPQGEGVQPLRAQLRHARVVNAFTFSKLYGVAGLRLGFLTGQAPLVAEVENRYKYTNYTPNSFSQSAVYALIQDEDVLAERRRRYAENLEIVRTHLAGRCVLPEGGFFAFLPLTRREIVQEALARGVGLVSGHLFGASYGDHARLCFTAEPPDRLTRCCEVLLSVLEGRS